MDALDRLNDLIVATRDLEANGGYHRIGTVMHLIMAYETEGVTVQ